MAVKKNDPVTKKPVQKKKKVVKKKQVKQKPVVTYKNMGLMNSKRTFDGSSTSSEIKAPTKRDSTNYRKGFEYGLKNIAPKKSLSGEGYMRRGGRWEGQNHESSINQKKKKPSSLLSNTISFVTKYLNKL